MKDSSGNNTFFTHLKSPIPPHLSKKERAEWELELGWQQKEIERRRREGYYSNFASLGARLKIKFFKLLNK